MTEKSKLRNDVSEAEIVHGQPKEPKKIVNQIGIDDLNSAASIIGVAVKRGAFEPTEIRQVGELYEKLTSFIQHQIKMHEGVESENNGGPNVS